jgi:signal transduction histidine kinase
MVDVSALAAQVAGRLREERPGHPVDFVVPQGLRARADPLLLRQVLEELLRNAWQFTGANARVRLGVSPAGAMQEFSVCDNGVGFDESFAHHLFGPFQRLHAEGEPGGLGLGLAIAQRIVARHGGAIRGEVRPGGGACFTFSLPD